MRGLEKEPYYAFRLLNDFAGLFGALTILSAGAVLFRPDSIRSVAGDYVPFLVWFNFLAGIAYVIASLGAVVRKTWAVLLAFAIAGATAAVLLMVLVHIMTGGAFEWRTVFVLLLRTGLWLAVGILARRYLIDGGVVQ